MSSQCNWFLFYLLYLHSLKTSKEETYFLYFTYLLSVPFVVLNTFPSSHLSTSFVCTTGTGGPKDEWQALKYVALKGLKAAYGS